MMRLIRSTIVTSVFGFALTACGGAGTPPSPEPTATATAVPTPTAAPLRASYVFAGDPSGKTTVEYGLTGTAPIATLSATGAPNAFAFDVSGNIYVAFGGTSVEEHAAGTHRLIRTITGFHNVNDIALDAKGVLYVVDGNYATTTGSSNLFKVLPAAKLPSAVLLSFQYSNATLLTSVAVDSSGNVYAGAGSGSIYVFAPGTTAPTRTFSVGPPANALAFDEAGDLWIYASEVVGGELASTLSELVPGSNKPLVINEGALSVAPQSLAFDVSNNSYLISDPNVTYLGEQINGGVIEDSSAGESLPVLPFNFPVALAVDPVKNLYVLDSDVLNQQPTGTAEHISEFSFGSKVPTRTFESSGSAIGLSSVP